MRAIACTASLCLFALIGLGQTPPGAPVAKAVNKETAPKKEPPPGIIQSITIVGNNRYPAAEVVKATAVQGGDHHSAGDPGRGRLTLQSPELFNSVSDGFRFK